MQQKLSITILAALFAILLTAGIVTAQDPPHPNPAEIDAAAGSAFSYQGYLEDDGSPANGEYDFRFTLYDDPASGAVLGSPVISDNVLVTDGYFTTRMDFGAGVFSDEARYLKIEVRPGASTDPGDFVALSDRQELTPVPYAIYALNIPLEGSGISSSAAKSDHDHFGANWSGSDTVGLKVSNSSTNILATALMGEATGNGGSVGVLGKNTSSTGSGVYGLADSTTGTTYGVNGQSDSTSGIGVSGYASAATGTTYGVYGKADSASGYGVYSDGNAHIEGTLTWITKTSYLSIPAAAFQPMNGDNDTTYTNSGGTLTYISGDDGFIAPVSIPHGAVLKKLTWYWTDNSAADNASLEMHLVTSFGYAAQMVILSNSNGSGGQGSTQENILYNPGGGFDNSLYSAYIQVNLKNSNINIHQVVIEYTTTGP